MRRNGLSMCWRQEANTERPEIEELSQSFKVVGSAASAMGLTVEQSAGALEVLSKANFKRK